MESTMARRWWHMVCTVLFMLRKGMSKRKLAMDLHLLLNHGKVLGKLMMTHSHHDHANSTAAPVEAPSQSFSCRALDPALAVYNQCSVGHEVEFSYSNTPSYPSLHLIPTSKRCRRRHHGANGAEPGWYNYDAADIARVFEILNNEQLLNDDGPAPLAMVATPSPALWSSFGRSPAPVRLKLMNGGARSSSQLLGRPA